MDCNFELFDQSHEIDSTPVYLQSLVTENRSWPPEEISSYGVSMNNVVQPQPKTETFD